MLSTEISGPQRAETHLNLGDKRVVCFLNQSIGFYLRKSWPCQCFDQNSSGDKGPLKMPKTFLSSLPCPFFFAAAAANVKSCKLNTLHYPKGTFAKTNMHSFCSRTTTVPALCELCRTGRVLKHLTVCLVWTLKVHEGEGLIFRDAKYLNE